jgi:transcriptional regulator with XRE-family HTH domain
MVVPHRMTGGEAAPTAEIAKQVRVVLAQNVRRAREQAGMTQEDLANASGVARDTIARLEQGDREPRLLTLVAFSLALSLPLETLLNGIPGS